MMKNNTMKKMMRKITMIKQLPQWAWRIGSSSLLPINSIKCLTSKYRHKHIYKYTYISPCRKINTRIMKTITKLITEINGNLGIIYSVQQKIETKWASTTIWEVNQPGTKTEVSRVLHEPILEELSPIEVSIPGKIMKFQCGG